MRILVLPSWYPNEMRRDFAPYVRAQVESLARNGVDVTLVYTAPYSWKWVLHTRRIRWGRVIREKHNLHEIVVYRPKTHFKPLDLAIRNMLGKRELKRLQRESSVFDAIHVHTYEAAGLAYWYGQRCRIPVLLTEHFTGFARGIIGKWEMALARKCFSAVETRMAVSLPFARLLEEQTGYSFKVIPNYVDTGFFSPADTGDSEGSPFLCDFVAIGHLLPKKNHSLLIESFALLKPKKDNLKLTIIGEGVERRNLELLIENLGLGDNVELLGYCDPERILGILRTTSVYCMPSLYETFGIAVIEAMAVGLPAVVTPSGGPETIVDHGITGFVAASDRDSFSSAMDQALRHHWNRSEIRRQIVALYSEETVITRLKAEYSLAKRHYIEEIQGI